VQGRKENTVGKYFGTDGFRGRANENLRVEHAFKVGRYIGWYFGEKEGKKAKVVIGKDTRRSSYMFEYALVAGLTASGADAYLLHVTTTPCVSFVVRNESFDCGIMISASHNPFDDNGIKLIGGEGFKMEAAVEDEVEKYIDGLSGEIPLATGTKIGKTFDYTEGRQRYIDYLVAVAMESFGGTALGMKSDGRAAKISNLKVGLDLANGSATTVAKRVFETLGADIYVISDKPDGENINTGCGSTHLENISKFVRENGLDVGFAYDGDADRCLCVDENGKEVTGDEIMFMCSEIMKSRGELSGNKVVTTVMSNIGLYKALDELSIGYEKTAVGDKYVSENMLKNGYAIGGENSGHIIFSRHSVTGDGILTSIKILSVLLEKGEKLSALAGRMRVYPQVLINVRVTDKKLAMNDAAVLAAVDEAAKRLGSDGRVLVRESGTEPLVRVMVEAGTLETCEKEANSVVDVIKSQGFAV